MAPRRRNPKGARGLRPNTALLASHGPPGRASARALSSARKPRARDTLGFVSTLLGHLEEAGALWYSRYGAKA